MENNARKPGSVRLSESQYEELKRLGLPNESAYVNYKLNKAQTTLAVVKEPEQQSDSDAMMEDRLTIQRLAMENQKLTEKLDELTSKNESTLNGVPQQVHSLLQDELRKRDFEQLTKEHSSQEKQIEGLEQKLQKAEKETQSKQEEIEALVKKLGFVELGKALLPSAISGLAKQYPKQMQSLAGTLGQLGLSEAKATETNEDEYVRDIIEYLQEALTPEQLEQLLGLMLHIAKQLPEDPELVQKTAHFLEQITKKQSRNTINQQPITDNKNT